MHALQAFVYTFGFVLMTPQLYINYKLKSVAHLPWRFLCYRSLNTVIDDLFAFVIRMPTMHRLVRRVRGVVKWRKRRENNSLHVYSEEWGNTKKDTCRRVFFFFFCACGLRRSLTPNTAGSESRLHPVVTFSRDHAKSVYWCVTP